ncbi:CehA/McbA family metallohydrolase [Actinacidiphila epipremni]|uniref:CehA/McbA family metallohydrolase n=1 Tax=Actinacidiphila epipremni TaxID=2053013 RepID=A0ABX0ZWM4_9ACTN|nr:CehA/McbA family metallohydrolase [Actinacidiphila epipremni]NJP46961.1 CehA/McbA family metallohydrolase [Actinacidiphila epipremni]
MDRRDVLKLSAVAGAAGVITLAPVDFAAADDPAGPSGATTAAPSPSGPGGDLTRTVTGHLPTGVADFVYLPVQVPHGIRQIAVSYTYDRPAVPAGTLGNACDIGIFDQRGTGLGGRGFRGWSGGARTEFAISAEESTPGYLAGPVEAGTWYVVLGPYTVAPQGLDYSVTVTLTPGERGRTPKPDYPPEQVKGRGRGWYRGDCHLHTVHSDGKRTLEDLAALARAAKLDFINSSDHNTSSAHPQLGPLAGDDLLILTGEEITTRNGHYLAIGLDGGEFVDWRYRARDDAFDGFARQIRRAGGIVVPAHPYGTSLASQWKFGYDNVDAIEVWNGPWTTDDEASLFTWDNLLTGAVRRGDGHWIPAMGNSDAHRDPDVVGLPQTVVLAEGLNRKALQDGIRAGRSWIAENADVQLSFTAVGPRGEHAGIGERLQVALNAQVTVSLTVSGVPADALLRLVSDEGQVFAAALPASGTVTWQTTASLAAYVRAEVRHPAPAGTPAGLLGPAVAITNPIWLGRR